MIESYEAGEFILYAHWQCEDERAFDEELRTFSFLVGKQLPLSGAVEWRVTHLA